MSMYTIIFIGVAFLVLLGLALFFIFVNWLSNKIDKSDRLGQQTKKKNEK